MEPGEPSTLDTRERLPALPAPHPAANPPRPLSARGYGLVDSDKTTSAPGRLLTMLGWVNTKTWDQTHDVAKSSGWTAFVLDTNGNGRRDAYVGPDDPKAGWKGCGLWAANGDRTPWLVEGGKGSKPFAAHFQVRPNPLAH